MNGFLIHTVDLLSYGCIGVGLLFWFWGTWPLVGDRSVLYKLHSLSIADTLGSISIVVGLLLKIPREWPLLLLAILSLAVWNTMLGYVLAYCSSDRPNGLSSDFSINFMDNFSSEALSHLPDDATNGLGHNPHSEPEDR